MVADVVGMRIWPVLPLGGVPCIHGGRYHLVGAVIEKKRRCSLLRPGGRRGGGEVLMAGAAAGEAVQEGHTWPLR